MQAWIEEKTSLPPTSVPKLIVDEAKLERWRQEQAALHSPGEPTTALDCDGEDIEEKVAALLIWQQRTVLMLKTVLENHRENFEFLESQRIRTVRQTFVTQTFLDNLIYTHHRPDALRRHWHNQMPQLIDEVTGDDLPPDLAELHKEDSLAWQLMVQHYTQLIDHVADFYEKHRKDDDDDWPRHGRPCRRIGRQAAVALSRHSPQPGQYGLVGATCARGAAVAQILSSTYALAKIGPGISHKIKAPKVEVAAFNRTIWHAA